MVTDDGTQEPGYVEYLQTKMNEAAERSERRAS